MIARMLDSAIGAFAPGWAVRRAKAREALRSYVGAESHRLTGGRKPQNRSAEAEMQGALGADGLRAWSRELVRNNAIAWGVVDTIVSSVVGCGIFVESALDTDDDLYDEQINDARDALWREWCEVCDLSLQLSFEEMQALVMREVVEAGEALVHLVPVPQIHKGVYRPVPLALEFIEADRLASEYDSYRMRQNGENRIVRGVEIDADGEPVAYYIYPDHPRGVSGHITPEPQRIEAIKILHIFRRERVQSRGTSWFAPVLSWLRDLGVYVDNEMQASAVASCAVMTIKTEGTFGDGGVNGPVSTAGDSAPKTDVDGNRIEYMQPGQVYYLNPGESAEGFNPGRPNSAATPWIELILRAVAVGTGLSYETVARNYSGTTYSSNRASQLEDRRRFRRWQNHIMINQLVRPVHDAFSDAAAIIGHHAFPAMYELHDHRRTVMPVEYLTPMWEWVDPVAEQTSSDAAIASGQSTYRAESAARGGNWRRNFKQRGVEERYAAKVGFTTPAAKAKADVKATEQKGDAEALKAEAAIVTAATQESAAEATTISGGM